MFQHFAVVGNPIKHSLSPLIHQHFAMQANIELTYHKIKADESRFEQEINTFFTLQGRGLNITAPFKQRAFAMAQQLSARCQQAQAANTLWMQDQQLHAGNTDGIGLLRDLNRHICLREKKVLIIGAGGAARGILSPLIQENPAVLVVANRTQAKAEEFRLAFPQIECVALTALSESFDVVINATAAQLVNDFSLLPSQCLAQQPFCYDLAYKQKEDTPFVAYAKNQGCDAIDGLGMLVEQAAEAFFIWHQIKPKTEELLNNLRK